MAKDILVNYFQMKGQLTLKIDHWSGVEI